MIVGRSALDCGVGEMARESAPDWLASSVQAGMAPSVADGGAGLWLRQVFFLPGDCALSALLAGAPRVAELLGLSAVDFGGWMSAGFSAVLWLALVLAASISVRALGAGVQLVLAYALGVTAPVRGRFGRLRRSVRSHHHQLRHSVPLARRIEPYYVEMQELGPVELALLRCYATLPPGHAQSVSEAARALNIRAREAAEAIDSLRRLDLLSRGLPSSHGDTVYALTRAGTLFLRARIGAPATAS